MSTPERPTNFPPKESLSREVGEFIGSPSRPEISDGSGYHVPSPSSFSESHDKPLFEAFGYHIPGVSQNVSFSGAPFSLSVAPIPLRYGVYKYEYDESSEGSDNAITSRLRLHVPLIVCTSSDSSSSSSSTSSVNFSDFGSSDPLVCSSYFCCRTYIS
jgi:hypothetical protein